METSTQSYDVWILVQLHSNRNHLILYVCVIVSNVSMQSYVDVAVDTMYSFVSCNS